MLKGDIILSREKGNISKAIQALTLGKYSHAAIYLGAESYAEAAGPNTLVAANNIQRLLFEKPEDCCVLRLKDATTSEQRDLIVMNARQLIGQRYSLEEAKKVLNLKYNKAISINEQFCSRYVAQVYSAAGYEIVKTPDYCSPNAIFRSKNLENVSNIIKKLTKAEIEVFSKPSEEVNIMHQLTENVLSKTSLLTGEYISDFPKLNSFLILNQKYDKEFSQVFINSGYLDFWRNEKIVQPENFDAVLLRQTIPNKNKRDDYAQKNIDIINDGLKRFEINKMYFKDAVNEFKLVTLQLQLGLYENLIQSSYEKIKVFEEVIKRSA
jgi:hypothetical protein